MQKSSEKRKVRNTLTQQKQPGIEAIMLSKAEFISSSLVKKGILVNGVAPGPIWTPLIPATFPPKDVASFGTDVPLGRAGQSEETAPCYVFLASDDSSYMTGQILHPNGGEIING
jgi:NAD(P)-dependent dehydrogenase (short-subunit alcohol dehydrogenase family)